MLAGMAIGTTTGGGGGLGFGATLAAGLVVDTFFALRGVEGAAFGCGVGAAGVGGLKSTVD